MCTSYTYLWRKLENIYGFYIYLRIIYSIQSIETAGQDARQVIVLYRLCRMEQLLEVKQAAEEFLRTDRVMCDDVRGLDGTIIIIVIIIIYIYKYTYTNFDSHIL